MRVQRATFLASADGIDEAARRCQVAACETTRRRRIVVTRRICISMVHKYLLRFLHDSNVFEVHQFVTLSSTLKRKSFEHV